MTTAAVFRRLEFQRACANKHKHTSRGKAEAHIRSLVRRFGQNPDTLSVYRCRWCKAYHVGHRR